MNLVVIAAPKDGKDWFITNATTYARLYFSKGLGGEVVSTIKDVGTIEELLDQIETTEPDRMIGRIDIFCHGTIEPTAPDQVRHDLAPDRQRRVGRGRTRDHESHAADAGPGSTGPP